MESETTVTVETAPATDPAPETGAESSERTIGRLEAETEHLAEAVEEATETAETAEAAAETATNLVYGTAAEISELRAEISELRERLESLELEESEDDQENNEVQEVEIPIVIEQADPAPEANRGVLAKILFG